MSIKINDTTLPAVSMRRRDFTALERNIKPVVEDSRFRKKWYSHGHHVWASSLAIMASQVLREL